jgi:hypothetical protein
MSQKTVASDADIPEEPDTVAPRSNKRRNAVFMGKEEHTRLMKLIDEEDCDLFAMSSASNIESLTELELF